MLQLLLVDLPLLSSDDLPHWVLNAMKSLANCEYQEVGHHHHHHRPSPSCTVQQAVVAALLQDVPSKALRHFMVSGPTAKSLLVAQ